MARKKSLAAVREYFREKLPPELMEFFREQGAKGGKLGGPARAKKLTPEQRSEIARKASAAAVAVRRKGKKGER